jgi:hypothetical protein
MRKLTRVLCLAALAAQLAPAIHGLVPHDDEGPVCKDGLPVPHVEESAAAPHGADCVICHQALGGGILLEAGASDAICAPTGIGAAAADALAPSIAPSLPGCRGPPSCPA